MSFLIISLQKAGRSSGFLDVIKLSSTTTSLSLHLLPALTMSFFSKKLYKPYDNEGDAAYVYLARPIKTGLAKNTDDLDENFIRAYDDRKLLGVETLSAIKMLKKSAS